MSRSLQPQEKNSTIPLPGFTLAPNRFLTSHCACGGSSSTTASCPECESKRFNPRRRMAESKQSSASSSIETVSQDSTIRQSGNLLNDGKELASGHNFGRVRVEVDESQQKKSDIVRAFNSDVKTGTVDAATGITTFTATCCPLHEGEQVSSMDKFTVIDAGPLPDLGGTQARYRFEYVGATDNNVLANCACNCCAFVQYVKGFFEINGTRVPHILPGSGVPLSPTTMQQDSPIIPHGSCRVATAGGGRLNDTPGSIGIRPTDNVNYHLEFDARTIDRCNADNIVASRAFTLDITGAHPRSFVARGNLG